MKTKTQSRNLLFMIEDSMEGVKYFSKTSIALIEALRPSGINGGYTFGVTMKETRPDGKPIYFEFNGDSLNYVADQLTGFSIELKQ